MKIFTLQNTTGYLYLFLSLFLVNSSIISAQESAALPLNLAEFRGEVTGNSIHLSWAGGNSFNQQEYIIERAGEDANFNEIGTANIEEDFDDVHPLEAINYYRLISIGSDGRKAYSHVIAVEYEASLELKLSPNPASNFINIGFFLEEHSSASILVMSQQGLLIEQQKVETLLGGAQQVEVNLQDYSSGVYVVRITQGSTTRTRKFVVQ